MIFSDDYAWHPLPQPGDSLLGFLTAETIYDALTKGAVAPPSRHFMTQFENADGSLIYSFRDFSSDIYHEELITCSQVNSVGPDGKRSNTLRWGIGGDFRCDGRSEALTRKVSLEGRWTKNHDGMTTRFDSGPDLRSTVYLHGVKLNVAVDEATMATELRDFLTGDLKRVEPPPSKPVDMAKVIRQLTGED